METDIQAAFELHFLGINFLLIRININLDCFPSDIGGMVSRLKAVEAVNNDKYTWHVFVVVNRSNSAKSSALILLEYSVWPIIVLHK